VANSLDLTVDRLDPATGRVTATIPVGDGPGAIVAAKDGVWVSDEFNATLDRIDPEAKHVDRVISVGSSPQGLAVAGSGVWVAARPFAAASHRGGTLTEVSSYLPQREPALAYDVMDLPALGTVYDGLVALRRSGGAQGFTLVPDLARTLPRPADSGTAYTFTLRRGIRYSNGVLVRASDFRRGIQRQLSFGVNPGYYEGIPRRAGMPPAPAALRPVRRDRHQRRGGHRHLPPGSRRPRLPLQARAAPRDTGPARHPRPRQQQRTVPARNGAIHDLQIPAERVADPRADPYFRQWSYAAQPVGYPNVIRFEQVADPGKQQSAVAAGTADLVDITLNGQSYRDLAVRYPTRVHPGLKIATSYLFLNTRRPPFTNRKARQAVNYAIDRSRIIRLLHGSGSQETVTCQILPAGLPAYQRYCPYTAGPKNGAWHRPDLAKAIRLARASGTTDVPVTVWNIASNGGGRVGAYLGHLLRRLGYRATVRNVSGDQWYTAVVNSHRKIQMGAITAWLADFPTASDYFLPVLTCQSFYDNPASTLNIAEYCNPHLDKLASQAQSAQLTNPAAARKMWARIDRIVTNQAPWVPISNTSPTAFVSARVRNYQESPYYGPLLDQAWVR
jgi:ABC-type transport system substrate-binding protein